MKVAQSRPTLWDPTDYRVHGILHARILEWVANPFSRGSSQPRNWTRVSCIAGGFFTSWATSSVQFSSVQFIRSVVSDSLWPHESQAHRPPCLSPPPGVYSTHAPLSRWCHSAISSSVAPLLLLPSSPPSIRVFSNKSTLHMRWPVSASASVYPMNTQDWSLL